MLFEIDKNNNAILPVRSSWIPKEVELEHYLISTSDTEIPVLEPSVFGEPLLLVSNQVRTRSNKRADILAIDRAGNGVIVELKRDIGVLGVETQVLRYLADFASHKGRDFIARFSKYSTSIEEDILGFIGGSAKLDDINQGSRVILLARGFDPTLFSMGEWLANRGVAFRCIEYAPVEVGDRRFLSFSVAFDRSPEPLFPVVFGPTAREPGYFWHNIARANDNWWQYLVKNEQIPACFENKQGDQGERILKSYITGDVIVAYAKGFGAVGWGVVEKLGAYKLLNPGDPGDKLDGNCLHRLSVSWKATVPNLENGIYPETLREEFGIYHPRSTSVSIENAKAKKLVERLSNLFARKT